jgi:anti-sigma factor RsiW
MTRHLSDEMALEAVDGGARDEAKAHLGACTQCELRVEELRSTLHALHGSGVPEPPAEYFTALRREVRRRIDAEPGGGWWRTWRWLPALATAGAMALIVALALAPGQRGRVAPATIPAWTAAPADEDVALTAVRGLGPTPEDVALATGQLGIADEVVSLSDEESADLVQAVRTEIRSGAL